jgi:hypothetical protein
VVSTIGLLQIRPMGIILEPTRLDPPGTATTNRVRQYMAGDLSRLHHFITDYYDLEDFRTLCFQQGVDYDSLPGEGWE